MFTLQACSRKVIMLHEAPTRRKRHFIARKLSVSCRVLWSELLFFFFFKKGKFPLINHQRLLSVFCRTACSSSDRQVAAESREAPGRWRLGVQHNSSVSFSSGSIFVSLDRTSRIQRGAKITSVTAAARIMGVKPGSVIYSIYILHLYS